MGEHKYTGPIAGLFQKMADIIGKDVYYVNFLILMFFTLFEVAAVFFEVIPGTDIEITRTAVWGVLIVVGIIKGYGIAAFFMHLKGDPFIYTRTALFPVIFAALSSGVSDFPTLQESTNFLRGVLLTGIIPTLQSDTRRLKLSLMKDLTGNHALANFCYCYYSSDVCTPNHSCRTRK